MRLWVEIDNDHIHCFICGPCALLSSLLLFVWNGRRRVSFIRHNEVDLVRRFRRIWSGPWTEITIFVRLSSFPWERRLEFILLHVCMCTIFFSFFSAQCRCSFYFILFFFTLFFLYYSHEVLCGILYDSDVRSIIMLFFFFVLFLCSALN